MEKNDEYIAEPTVDRAEKSELSSVVNGVGKQFSKTASQAQHDGRDIADPSEGIELGKSKPVSPREVLPTGDVAGVVSETKNLATDLAGETKNKSVVESESANSIQNSVSRKKDEDEDELKNLPGLSLEKTEDRDKSVGVNDPDVLGHGERTDKNAHFKIDQIIGKQTREVLSNGQQVISLDIDKEKWLATKPDSDGNLKVSLYSPLINDKDDNFSNSIIKVPYHKVATLAPDENGRIKLLISEQRPGENSKLDVHLDTRARRDEIEAKTGKVFGQDSSQIKEKVLDKPLEHGFWGYPMEITGRELIKQMSEEKQAVVDKMDVNSLKSMLQNPDNQCEYAYYEKMYAERLVEKCKGGAEVKICEDDEAGYPKEKRIETIVLVKEEGYNDRVKFKDSDEKHHDLDLERFVKAAVIDKNLHEEIKNETLVEIAKAVNLNPESNQIKDVEKSKKFVLERSEHQIKTGGEVNQDGSVSSQVLSKSLSKAIYNNDHQAVSKILESGGQVVRKEHMALMKEMKQNDMPLSEKIKHDVESNFNPAKKGIRV